MSKADESAFRMEQSIRQDMRKETNVLRIELNDAQRQLAVANKSIEVLEAKVAECVKALKLIVAMPAIQMHLMAQGHRPNVGVTLSPAEHQAPMVEHKNNTLASVQAGLGSLAATAKRS
jgi:hypothetical protein